MKPLSRYLKLILINAFILLGLLLLIEFACRIFVSEINLGGTSYDIFIENRYKTTTGFLPNAIGHSFQQTIEVDDNGFLKSRCSENPSHKKTVLFIGDSVAQGAGVPTDKSFISKLTCHHKDSINIVNASLIGYKFFDYVNAVEILLEEEKIKPELVVLNYCLNDVYSDLKQTIKPGYHSISGRLINFFKTRSYFYVWLKNKMLDRKKTYYLFDSAYYNDQEALNFLETKVKELVNICAAKNVGLQVVSLPYEYQLRKFSPEFFHPQDAVEAIFKSSNIRFHRTEQFLKNSDPDSESLYLYGDGIHFSEKGHERLFEFFLKHVSY